MGFYLEDHPPARSQFRRSRRESPSGVVVLHSAENVPDLNPPDTGAEAVASFIARRTDPGSYHDVCDSDSSVALVPWAWEAYHDATGTNPHSVGISAAFRSGQIPTLDPGYVAAVARQMARRAAAYALWLRETHGIVIPVRRINAGEARSRVPGFVTHAELDPTRRSDPGAAFPHDVFLAEYARLTNPKDWFTMATQDDLKAAIREVLDERMGRFPARFLGFETGTTGVVWACNSITLERANLTGDSFAVGQYEALGYLKRPDGEYWQIGPETLQFFDEVPKLPVELPAPSE